MPAKYLKRRVEINNVNIFSLLARLLSGRSQPFLFYNPPPINK